MIAQMHYSLLPKIISGGQNGVDQAALRAAKKLGLVTGGTAPKGWRTLDGPAPELAKFGLIEDTEANYAIRTAKNVYDANITLRIARNFNSAGEICTLKAIKKCNQEYLDIPEDKLNDKKMVQSVAMWLILREPTVVNVAGNSEMTAPGIGQLTEDFLTELFSLLVNGEASFPDCYLEAG